MNTYDALQLAGQLRRTARSSERKATEALRLAVLDAIAAGMPEQQVARLGQVDRMTVRKWVGK